MKIKAYPKINLVLDILKKDKSGYHEIFSVMTTSRDFVDEITVSKRKDNKIIFKSDNKEIERDKNNTCFQVLKILRRRHKQKGGLNIFLSKRIPFAAGFGGGSSDAAAMIKGLNKLWNLKMSEKEMLKIAEKIGMDTPFFIAGGTALVTHFGEKIQKLPALRGVKIKLLDTGRKIFSKEAYRRIKMEKCGKNITDSEKLLEMIKKREKINNLALFHNDFEHFCPKEIFSQLKKNEKIILAGSGGGCAILSLKFRRI